MTYRCNTAAIVSLLIVIIVTPLLLSGCGGKGTTHPNGWFSIEQPNGWSAPEFMAETTDMSWQNVSRLNFQHDGVVGGGVVLGRFADGVGRASIDDLADKFAAQYQADPGATIHKRTPTRVDGNSAIRFDMEYPLGGKIVCGIYYYVHADNDYYSVDFSCRPGIYDVFDKAHEAVLKSLRFH